jgi:hypothetical protein
MQQEFEMRIIVVHTDDQTSGTCGHTTILFDVYGKPARFKFRAEHPDNEDEDVRLKFAKRLIETDFGIEWIKKLDWLDCKISAC